MIKPELLWIDLEMTGLDVLKDKIIEIAALVTDFNLTKIPDSEFHRIIHCDTAILEGMDDWCTQTHGAVRMPFRRIASLLDGGLTCQF